MEAKNTSAAKKIEIEFLYLDLDVCTRCRATGELAFQNAMVSTLWQPMQA